MQVSARVDYALRSLLVVAWRDPARVTRDEICTAQAIPPRYLEDILVELRRSGLVVAQRGHAGGYRLGRPAGEITVAQVARAVDGPLALIQGERPEHVSYPAPGEHLGAFWIGLRAAIRSVMEQVSLADLLEGTLPPQVRALVDHPDAWLPH